MKTTRYRFEQTVAGVKEDTTEWLRDELRSVLESDKDFTRKCDYIGFSIAHLDAEVASIDEEIKELQSLKKQLKQAKDITLKVGAEVFAEYGVERLEGVGISSITMTKPTSKTKSSIDILDEESLVKLGYYIIQVDAKAVEEAYAEEITRAEVAPYISVVTEEVNTPAKLKINKSRGSSNTALDYNIAEEVKVS